MKRIYLDHAAATPMSTKALQVTADAMKRFSGNPSAIHQEGRVAHEVLESARKEVALALSASPSELVFTSSATESNNLAILGVVTAARVQGISMPHIIISAIEHPSVLEVARALEKEKKVHVSILGVDDNGFVDTRELRKLITPETVLVSIMYANNEIGTIEPVAEIAKEVRRARKVHKTVYPYFHTDAAQALNYLDVNVLRLGVDLMTLSSTKTYGPRGVGALFVKRGVVLHTLMHGGSHEDGRRPGTEATALASGFAFALREARLSATKESKRVQKLRDMLAKSVLDKISGVAVNGDLSRSLPNILNLSISNVDSDALVLYLNAKGIAASGQSACKSSEDAPSHVIMALGKKEAEKSGSIRFSLGRSTTREEVLRVARDLPEIVTFIRTMQAQSDEV